MHKSGAEWHSNTAHGAFLVTHVAEFRDERLRRG